MTPDDMEARTPAPEGPVWYAWTERGIPFFALPGDEHPATAKPLYASPVVPVGSGEPVARATCQDCGGHIEGWICQSCDRQFRENDAGSLVFEDQPVVPVGVSEAAQRLLDYADARKATFNRDDIRAVADAIIAALRPTDTGANHD